MKIFKDKNFYNYLIILINLLCIEIIFRWISGYQIFNYSFLRVFVECNIISLILNFIFSLFSKKIRKILNGIIVFIACLYAYLQLGFNNFLGVYMSVKTMGQVGAVKSYIWDFLKAVKGEYYLVFLPFLVFVILSVLISKIKNNQKVNDKIFYYFKNSRAISYLSFIILLICFMGTFEYLLDDRFMEDQYQVVSNKELFKGADNPGLVIKEFGIIPFSFIDLKSKITGSTDAQFTYLAYTNKEVTQREFDDTLWQEIIDNETNKTLNKLNEYYINNMITDKNDYTGYFQDKNLIIIMMESVNDIIVNKEYYPNFYRLMENGWYFENNYSPRNSCATGNNEFSAMTGLYSIYNTCTSNVYLDNTYFESIFNLFNNDGYITNSFHNYTNAYYYRTIIHPNMGSQKYYDVNDLKIPYSKEYGTWSSDEDLMSAYLNVLDNSNAGKFMSYITTVTSHQPYYDSYYGNLYYDMTKDTTYSENIRHYMSKLKVLDNALGILIDGLSQRNLLEDTVIVLFGDHYPYGIPVNNLAEVLDRSLEDYDNEKVPLLIYNPSLTREINETYTSYLNLTPTMANLFGLDFDPRLYSGVDIFSSSYNNTVVFADSSWKNDLAYYNAATGLVKYYTDFRYTVSEIKDINSEIYAKTSSSSLAIKNNYFAYLNNKLNDLKQSKELKEEGINE